MRSFSQLGRDRVLMEEITPMAANMVMMEEPPELKKGKVSPTMGRI